MDEPKEFEYRNVEQYVESQLGPDEAVEFAQRVTTRRVLGEFHEVWDVRTTTLRLWVITNLTNYYLQDDFPSYEVALTYHLGVKVVLSERSRKELRLPEHEDVLGSAWRRHQQAVDAYTARLRLRTTKRWASTVERLCWQWLEVCATLSGLYFRPSPRRRPTSRAGTRSSPSP